MFHLTAKTGPLKGSSWAIGDRTLVIGRESACDVSILDPLVSRRHCEVGAVNGSVHVKDLGSSNATFVNGESIKEVSAKTGDEVAVGNTIFIITKMQGDAPTPPSTPRKTVPSPLPQSLMSDSPLPPTNAMTLGEPFYLNKDADSLFKHGKPRSARDLAVLYRLGRTLSQTETVPALLGHLAQQLIEYFQPQGMSVLLCTGEDNKLTPFPTPEIKPPSGEVVDRMAPKANSASKGMLLPERLRTDDDLDLRTTMLAPLVFGQERIGLLALQSETPAHLYDESDLEFLLAIAHTSAPILKAVEKLQQLRKENARLVSGMAHAGAIIGDSAAVNKVRMLARQCAPSNLSVLLLGETGTGKELVARMIHDLSDRADRPLTTVNCAAIPDELFESEVFGYERGAFTGATARKIGLFEQSDRGTLFLDEIGELPASLQTALLGALERGSFRRVGGSANIDVDVRVVAATNRDLRVEVNSGNFRQDLYYRIAVVLCRIPPLRERVEDIPILVEHFLREAGFNGDVSEIIPRKAMEGLRAHRWPGNVRELRNFVDAALAMGEAPPLDRGMSDPIDGDSGPTSGGLGGDPGAQSAYGTSTVNVPLETLHLNFKDARAEVIREFEAAYLKELLERCQQNVSKAARTSEIHRSYLNLMLKRHKLR